MKRDNTKSSRASSIDGRGEPAKLVSLLALATGAVAMPQGAEADIIYQNLGAGVHVRPVTADHYYFVGLPGNIKVGFTAHSGSVITTVFNLRKYKRTINLSKISQPGVTTSNNLQVQFNATGDGLAKRLDKGAPWNAASGSLFANGAGVARDSASIVSPANFDHKYFAWDFTDSSNGHALRYGWIEVSLVNTAVSGHSGGPDLTVFGYAWDNTGAKPAMGATQTPEPSSAALLALGALALGARGVRHWRRKRVPPAKS
jgi:hypothetical protein